MLESDLVEEFLDLTGLQGPPKSQCLGAWPRAI